MTVARATDVADIAVFAPRHPFAAHYRPPLRIEPPSRVAPPGARVAFHSFGFMGTQNGVSTQGALTAVDAGGWFVADGDEEFRRFIEEGLSGAPVFADGRVLGMVVQRLERDARQGLVIPAFALARAWPPLASPYPGLPAFDSDTAHLFFGRGRAVTPDAEPTGTLKELLDRLNAQRLVALMGASGSGKSSLAKAGVADVYRRRGWIVLTLRPGLEPLRNLAEAIASAVEGLKPSPERIQAMDRWEKALEANRLTEALALARGQGAGGVLIVVDQFEEFFPGREDRADAARTEVLATEMACQDALRRHDLATAQDWADGAARVRGRPTLEQADFIAATRVVDNVPKRRTLDIPDLVAEQPAQADRPAHFTRVALDSEGTGAVREGHLQFIELAVPLGCVMRFTGTITGVAEKPDTLLDSFRKASRLIRAIGSNKSSGFGEVVKIELSPAERAVSPPAHALVSDAASGCRHIDIAFALDRPFLVNSAHTTANEFKGAEVIPGAGCWCSEVCADAPKPDRTFDQAARTEFGRT